MRQDAVTPAQRALAEKLRSVVPWNSEFREFRVGDIWWDWVGVVVCCGGARVVILSWMAMLCHANDNISYISVFLLALYVIQ
jgi:hypothetical protein